MNVRIALNHHDRDFEHDIYSHHLIAHLPCQEINDYLYNLWHQLTQH